METYRIWAILRVRVLERKAELLRAARGRSRRARVDRDESEAEPIAAILERIVTRIAHDAGGGPP